MQYPFRIIHSLKKREWISVGPYHVNAPRMSIRVFLSEWIFRQGYYHGFCMYTSTRGLWRLGKGCNDDISTNADLKFDAIWNTLSEWTLNGLHSLVWPCKFTACAQPLPRPLVGPGIDETRAEGDMSPHPHRAPLSGTFLFFYREWPVAKLSLKCLLYDASQAWNRLWIGGRAFKKFIQILFLCYSYSKPCTLYRWHDWRHVSWQGSRMDAVVSFLCQMG